MLRYFDYIKESTEDSKFKKGDKVIFTPLSNRSYYNIHKGALCDVSFVFSTNKGEYSIKTPSGASIMALEEELRYENEPAPVETEAKKQSNYIENQFKPKEETKPETPTGDDISIGKRVLVNGTEGKTEWKDAKGTVKKVNKGAYLIEFDEDDSKNQSKHSMLVKKEFVTSSDEPSADVIFNMGDKVTCVDQASEYYNKVGEVTNVWDNDNSCMVDFLEADGTTTSIYMGPGEIKISEYAKKKAGFNIPVNGPKEGDTKVEISEEEDDDDDVVIAKNVVPFKKEDLLEFSYKDFLLEEKISTHEDLLANKTKYEKALENPDYPKMKKAFLERSLGTLEIIESYYQFLINKIGKELPVYRTVEQIENVDLLKTKTKVRASDSKELTSKYSFDQGIIAYWKFKDAVVFRTI